MTISQHSHAACKLCSVWILIRAYTDVGMCEHFDNYHKWDADAMLWHVAAAVALPWCRDAVMCV